MNKYWEWSPGKSVGPFVFGETMDEYIEQLDLRKKRRDSPSADWDTYELPGFESWVVAERGILIEVHCADELCYHDTDLIGLSASEIRQTLGEEEQKEQNVGLGYALYYGKLGLTLFLENDRVSAASCGRILLN